MADIDKLQIQIKANAQSADKAIANLEKNVKALSNSLSRIKTGNLTALGNGVNLMGKGMQSFKGVGEKKFEVIAKGIERIASIDSSNMNALANGMIALGPALQTLNNVNPQGLNKTINALTRLNKSSMGSGIDTGSFVRLGVALSSMSTSLANAPTVSRSVTTLVSGVARLASAGANTGIVATELPRLGNAIKKLVVDMSQAPVVAQGTTQIVSAISQLANAGKKAEVTANNLDVIGDRTLEFIKKLQGAPQVSNSTVRLVSALGQLASAGRGANGVFNSLVNGGKRTTPIIDRLRNSFSSLASSMKRTNTSGRNFAQVVGMFYAKCFLIIRAFNKVGQSIGKAMDYIETYNYFQAAWGQVTEKADLSNWEELGYKSAQAYADSFRKESENMIGKLSGFTIGENGELKDTGAKSLGIDPDMAMNYQALFSQMGSSMGVASKYANELTNSLELIALDLASVKNMNFTDVLDDMSSGMTGMSRTVDKYGVNIRNAAMDAYLLEHGVNATVSSLSQADKALLRTTIILDSSRYAWGDLSKTINQPANQIRMLRNEASALGRTFGTLLLPAVGKVLPYLNALVIVVRRALEALGGLLGIEWPQSTPTPDNSGVSDYADSVDDANDAQKKAAKSAKEWKNQLMGFDEVNKLEDNKGSDGNGKNKGTDGASGIGDLFESVYDEYMKAWNDSYNKMEQDANSNALKLQKALTDAWAKNDGSALGKAVAKWLNKGITLANDNISILNSAEQTLATVVGTGINGFINEFDWKGTGKLIGTGLKGAFEAETTFFETVDWTNLGKNISDTITSFLDSDVMESYAGMWGAKIRSVIQFAFGSITNFDFSNLGKHIGESINAFLDNMGKVDKETGLTGWQELGKTISDGAIGILDTIDSSLDTLNWNEVGKSVADFLNEIDWGTVLSKVGKTILKALGKSMGGSTGSFAENLDFGNVAPLIGTALGLKLAGTATKTALIPAGKNLFSNLVSVIKLNGPKYATKVAKGLFNVVKTGVTKLPSLVSKLLPALKTFASSIFGEITLALTAAIGGWKLGNWLYEKDVFGIGNMTDKIVEKSGIGKLATKIADFFQFDLPDMAGKVAELVRRVSGSLLSNMPDWMKKLLGVEKEKPVEIKVNADTTNAENKIKPIVSDSTKNVTLSANTTTYDKDIKTATTSKTVKVKLTPSTSISSIAKQWAEDFEKNFKPKWNITLQNGKKGTVSQTMNMAYFTPAKADGGVYSNGKWHPVKQYAQGGMLPNQGQMFIAREAGPELVGTLGGNTAVMNNDQIVASVSSGVAVAVANAVVPYLASIANQIGNGSDIYIDSTKITDAILQNAHNRSIVNGGRNVFMSI